MKQVTVILLVLTIPVAFTSECYLIVTVFYFTGLICLVLFRRWQPQRA